MKASILAIGTELTTGQILNKNASSISEKLKKLGISVNSHITVPDDKKLMHAALNFAAEQSELLFITGGLGPTSDDFTRDVVSEWSGLRMQFDENSWAHIQQRLSSRGFTVRDMQKQQCYFPEGSQILTNREGTAHGFSFVTPTKKVYVLPGPPREIEAIWQDHIHAELVQKTQHLNKLITHSWDTMGMGESDVAFIVEEILKDRPVDLYNELGYRVHLPYVEFKLSYFANDSLAWSSYVKKIDLALKDITITRDFADVLDLIITRIEKLDFTFYDFVSQGYLHSRLSAKARGLNNWSYKQSDSAPAADMFEHEDDFLALLPFDETQAVVMLSCQGLRGQKTLEAPMKSELMSERRRQYFAEMALVELFKATSQKEM